MTPEEFYKWLSNEPPSNITLPPVEIRLGNADVMAARLLLWLFEEMPENATQGELEDVLDAARWWSIFWGSAHTANMKQNLTPAASDAENSAGEIG